MAPYALPEPGAPPGLPITSHVLITDQADRVLILRSATDAGRWQLPGGLVEAGESPLDALRREVREETGLDLDVHTGDLMAVEWVQARRPGRRDRLALVFAGPHLAPGDADCIQLQAAEVTEHRWEPPASALARLHPQLAARIRGPLQSPGSTLYRETHTERTPT